MGEFISRLKAHLGFGSTELRDYAIASIVLGLVLGFDDGQPSFQLFHWFINLILCLFLAAISLLVHLVVMRAFSLAKGYLLGFRLFISGLGAGAFLGIVSLGRLMLFTPFKLEFSHHEGMRLGRFRHGLNYFEMGLVGIAGCLALIFMAFIFKGIYSVIPSYAFLNAMRLNIMLAIATLLPFPKTPGSYALFGQLSLYVFVLASMILTGGLLFTHSVLYALLVGTLMGAVVGLAYFIKYEYK